MNPRVEKIIDWLTKNGELIEQKDSIKIEIHLKGESLKPSLTFYD